MFLLSPYRAVLRTPHAFGAFVSSLVGRLCYGIVGLSLLLTLTADGHHYGFAGLVMALFGLTIVLVSPFRAWSAWPVCWYPQPWPPPTSSPTA